MGGFWREQRREWGARARELRRGWRPLLGYEILCKLVSFAILAPATALLIRGIFAWSGHAAVSNFDLVGFFLSPQGLLLILVVATLSFAVAFFEIGGLALIGLAIGRGKKPSPLRVLRYFATRAHDLWLLALRQFAVLAVIAGAFLAVLAVTKTTLVGDGDIYFYVRTQPPEFRIAVAIVAISGLVGLVFGVLFLVRWFLALPLLLVRNRSPREALRESSELVRSRIGVGNLVRSLATWGAGIFLITMVLSLLGRGMEMILFPLAGNRVGPVLALTALFQSGRFLVGILVGFFISFTFAGLVVQWFVKACPEAEFPEGLEKAGVKAESERQQIRIQRWIFGGAVALLLGAIGIAAGFANRIEFNEHVAVTAHRGSSIAAPENTMAAIEQAIEDGSDYVEIDVQESADGVVVVIHDTDLRRLAGVNRNVWEVPWSEMREMDVGSWFSAEFADQRIPTLEETVKAVRGKAKLNVELKLNGHQKQLEAEVVRILREQNFLEDAIVMSLDYGTVRRVAELEEALPVGLTLSAGVGNRNRFEVDFLAVNANSVTRDLISEAHRAGREVHAWTVNDVDQMLTMIHLGVDNIITDRPEILVELLEERSQMTNAEKILLYLADLHEGRL